MTTQVRSSHQSGDRPDPPSTSECSTSDNGALVKIIQALSAARDEETIMAIVRKAARELTGSDGATFVLRDGDLCFYADEDAIAPLWKGRYFPMSACVSGWVMANRQAVAIGDIFNDPRVPADAYRPTFVHSLITVPIRSAEPIGAIGCYWAEPFHGTADDIDRLQALADSASVAIANVNLYRSLERRVAERTEELAAANRELEAFAYAASHDLRAPVRHMETLLGFLRDDCGNTLSPTCAGYIRDADANAARMAGTINGLLALSRVARTTIERETVDLSAIANQVIDELRTTDPERDVDVTVDAGATCTGDPRLMRVLLQNLLGNAWKFTATRQRARIEFGCVRNGDRPVFFVRDNGVGFDMRHADGLFGAFQRLHSQHEFAGSGIGLANAERVIRKHGGAIWAEAAVDAGATFFFTVGSEHQRTSE